MSGGSYDYAYHTVENFAEELRFDGSSCGYADMELRRKFKEHLKLVAEAMRAIEWNDSGDGDDREIALIKSILRVNE